MAGKIMLFHRAMNRNLFRYKLLAGGDKYKHHVSKSMRLLSSSASSSTSRQAAKSMERTKQLQEEITQIMQQSQKIEDHYKKQSLYTRVKRMIKASKNELFNIATSFLCFLLAFQVFAQRQVRNKLQGELTKSQEELEECKRKLDYVGSDDFMTNVISKYSTSVKEWGSDDASHSWWFGVRRTNQQKDQEILLRSVMFDELKNVMSEGNKNESNNVTVEIDESTAIVNDMLKVLESEEAKMNGAKKTSSNDFVM